MDLSLIILIASVLALALGIITFALAMKRGDAAEPLPLVELPHTRARGTPFFADTTVTPVTGPVSRPEAVSADVLVPRIERHICLENAAAEAFLEQPTPESLHSPTASPLLPATATRRRVHGTIVPERDNRSTD